MIQKLKRSKNVKEAAKKNVSPNLFKFSGKATKQWVIPNYVVKTYSEPASNHKFREKSKERWVGSEFQV